MKYLVANWKANKNLEQVKEWLRIFLASYQVKENVKVVIAPPLPFLLEIKNLIKDKENISLAAQDLSQFEEGSYTGEVTAKSLQGLIDYVILGHSERRYYFGETDEIIFRKIELASKYRIKTILCVGNRDEKIIKGVEMVAYEPVGAIGTGKNEPLTHVLEFRKNLDLSAGKFLYGGSVSDENIGDYLHSEQIDGLLIGGASLDPEQFLRIIAAV